MTPDAPNATSPSSPRPVSDTLVRTAAGAIAIATIAAGGCQTASSGEWSTRHQSMSVEKSAEIARQREDARLPVPQMEGSQPGDLQGTVESSETVAVVSTETSTDVVEIVAVEETVAPAPEPAPEPALEPAPETAPEATETSATPTEPPLAEEPESTPEPASVPPAEPAPSPEPSTPPVGTTDAPPAAAVVEREPTLPDPKTVSMSAKDAASQLLATAATSPYAALRANAIEGLAKSPDALRPLLGRALTDTNRGVRFVAANVLARAGLCDQSHLLEPLVRDESDSVRAGAIAALTECGVRVDQSPLAGMLRSDDPEIRANAYLALGMIGNRSAAPMIRESLGRGMRLVNSLRVKLVELQGGEALVRLGDTAEIEPIRAALFAPGEQGELTVLACQILGRLGDQQSQGALFRISRPAGEDVRPVEIRLAALRALADLGAPDRGQLFQWTAPYLKDLSPMVRAQACFTMGSIGGDSAVQALVPLLGDLDPNVQVAAAGAILAAEARR
jgi:HEAT repeat protein